MSAYNNISIVRNVAFSLLKKVLTVDFKIDSNSLYLHENKRVMLYYTDHDGEYRTIDPELYDVEINSEEKGLFQLRIKKSEVARKDPMRRMRAGYDWLLHHKQVDVAFYQEFGYIKAINRGLNTYNFALDIGTIPNTYMVINENGEPSTVNPVESDTIDRFRMYEGDKIEITKTGRMYRGEDSPYKEYGTKSADSVYKGEGNVADYVVDWDKMNQVDNTKSEDLLYKGEDTSIKVPATSEEDVATITMSIDASKAASMVDLLRANGVKDITLKL